MNKFNLFLFFTFCCTLFSCETSTVPEKKTPTNKTLSKIIEPIASKKTIVLNKNGITLSEIKVKNNSISPLKLNTKNFNKGLVTLKYSGGEKNNFSMAIIENNYTISHHTKPSITKEFIFGNNVFLSFLTDTNLLSIKTNNASVLKNVTFTSENLFNYEQPHLFYYLPQAKSRNILDFYLLNTSLKENKNYVEVTLNNTTFKITKWAAYKIEGDVKIKTVRIRLLNNKGELIDGPFNDSGERKLSTEI